MEGQEQEAGQVRADTADDRAVQVAVPMTGLELFVLSRTQEDFTEGRMSLPMFVALQKLVINYIKAVDQSRPSQPDRQTVWGLEARYGLYIGLKTIAEVWKKHPDWEEDW